MLDWCWAPCWITLPVSVNHNYNKIISVFCFQLLVVKPKLESAADAWHASSSRTSHTYVNVRHEHMNKETDIHTHVHTQGYVSAQCLCVSLQDYSYLLLSETLGLGVIICPELCNKWRNLAQPPRAALYPEDKLFSRDWFISQLGSIVRPALEQIWCFQ